MFSQTVEYALRAVVHLAFAAPQAQKTADIASATQVPMAYLAKVLQGLAKENIVHLKRGIGGGVSLARDPSKLSILDVVNAVEPIQRIKTCPLQLKAHSKSLCPLHRRLDQSLQEMEKAFAATTLKELMEERTTKGCDQLAVQPTPPNRSP